MSNPADQRNWLERLAERIPGYAGYVDRERRRDIDKLHREHLADRLRRLKSVITEVIGELTSGGRMAEVGPADSALKKLDRLENRIRFATYGYSGFFDVVKIEQQQLDSIYRFDLRLVEEVDKIEQAVQELKGKAGDSNQLKTGGADLARIIDETDRSFDERRRVIDGFGQEAPPGRPLFGGE